MTRKEIERLRAKFRNLTRNRFGVHGYPPEIVEAIFIDYMESGESIAATGRLWNRAPGTIASVLANWDLRQPDPTRRQRVLERQRVEGTGCFARYKRATPAELEKIINRVVATPRQGKGASVICIPAELRWEFRTWPWEKRADFIARLRVKLKSPKDRPATPFSSNVTPFDYTTPAAREIQARLNAGLTSRQAICRLDLCSQGVIYKGELYFWAAKTGYQRRGHWKRGVGRPALHRVIWEEHHGRPVPAHHVVRFIDGNENNLVPENLILRHRNDLARENQCIGLFRKSREATALLFRRAQENGKHGHIKTLQSLKAA